MPIGQLEPLYRYLTLRDRVDPVEALLLDMEQLSKGGYIKNISDGIHQVINTGNIQTEIATAIEAIRAQGEPIAFFNVSYQSIGKKMYIAVNRVASNVSKTALALCINEDDTVEVHFIEPDCFSNGMTNNKKLYSSISTVVQLAGGTLKHGFLRCETTFQILGSRIAIKCDFRLTRTTPFYILIANYSGNIPAAMIGSIAQTNYTEMEATCSR